VAALREAVQFLVDQGLSTQRACALLQFQRSTFYYPAQPDRNSDLEQQVRELAQRHPRYGYRRIWALLRRKQPVNKKRIHRLWKRSRLQVGRRPRKHRRHTATGNAIRLKACYPGHVWTYDFIHDRCLNGTPLKVLTVMDEFTREGLTIAVASSMPSERVRAVLAGLFLQYGAPAYLRSDNGPEFIAQDLRTWLAQQQTATAYIDPGCPWQNGYGESFNGTVRDECLNLYAFASVAEARVILERYRREYNEERPHSSLGYRSPAEFKRDWHTDQSSALDSNISS
jgi:putative transposase